MEGGGQGGGGRVVIKNFCLPLSAMSVVISAPLLPAKKGNGIQLQLTVQPQVSLLTGISIN